MGEPRLSTMPTQDSAPPPLAAEITRLRSLGRHNEAEMLAGVLREVMVANQPVSDSPQQDKGGWYQADEPHHHTRPETAYERICSLQKQIEKVQFETVHPVTSSTYNAPSQSEYYTEAGYDAPHDDGAWFGRRDYEARDYNEVSSVDEAARKVYEMALSSVEQDGPGTPEAHQKRVDALKDELEKTTGMHRSDENAEKASGVVLAEEVISNANKHSSTVRPADLVLAAHYIHGNDPASDENKASATSVVHASTFVNHLQSSIYDDASEHRSADEQRRIDHAARVHQLNGLLAATQSSMEPERLVKYNANGVDGETKDKLRDLAALHGLGSTTGYISGTDLKAPKLPETIGYGISRVIPVSETCPSMYAPKATTRIAELKRSMHDVGLNRGRRMLWSDLDVRSGDPREHIRPGNLDISKLSMSALQAGYRHR